MAKKVLTAFFIFIIVPVFLFPESIGQHVRFTRRSFDPPSKKKISESSKKTDSKIEKAFEILRLVLTFLMWILIATFILLIVMIGIKYILVLRKLNE